MSSFIVSRRTFQYIADCLYTIGDNPQYSRYFFSVREWLSTKESVLTFVNELITMNVKGYNTRYPNENETAFQLDQVGLKSVVQIPVLIRQLECVKYQSNESDEIAQSKIYNDVDKLIGLLALGEISKLPAYKEATWGYVQE